MVRLEAWLSALRESEATKESVALNPVIKLLDFMEEHMLSGRSFLLDSKAASSRSPTLASLEQIDNECMANWMRQWAF